MSGRAKRGGPPKRPRKEPERFSVWKEGDKHSPMSMRTQDTKKKKKQKERNEKCQRKKKEGAMSEVSNDNTDQKKKKKS